MESFGLELRTRGTVKSLFNDIDAVLGKNGINTGEVNQSSQIAAVAHSLQKMLQVDEWFDIITVKDCASLCQICISIERMRLYRTQHCIRWSEMTIDWRQALVAMVLDDFRAVLNN